MDYVIHILLIFLIYSVLGASLNLLMGYGGLTSIAHAAFFGIGGYTSAVLILNLGVNYIAATIVGIIVAAVLGAITSMPALRIKGDYLVVLTMGFNIVIYGLMMNLRNITQGTWGISGIPRPEIFGLTLVSPASYFLPVFLFSALCFLFIRRITLSPFGRVLKAMRENEDLTHSLGKNLLVFRALVFIVSTAIAAAAGSVFALYTTAIHPSFFTLDLSILLTALIALGGIANLWGTLVGAFVVVLIPEMLVFVMGNATITVGTTQIMSYDLVGPIRAIIYGALLVVFMRFRPVGIIPEYAKVVWRKAQVSKSEPLSPEERENILWQRRAETNFPDSKNNQNPPIEAKGLIKNFGGLTAVNNLTMVLPERKITALIGPNGAGKTTVFNLLTGFIRADAGRMYYRGQDISELPTHRIANLGVARSFQGAHVFNAMSVMDNVLVARPKQSGEDLLHLFFFPRRVARDEGDNRKHAMACLEFVGLSAKAQELAGELSFAEQKMLQIACILATEAEVLLLDEPVSGVDPMWIDQMLELMRQIASRGKTVCIIEHNLDVVKKIGDFAYFLDQGQVIASGTPSDLMNDRKLVDIYFGC